MEISNEINLLLTLIEENPFIYNKSLEGYSDDKMRMKCFACIANNINENLEVDTPCMY